MIKRQILSKSNVVPCPGGWPDKEDPRLMSQRRATKICPLNRPISRLADRGSAQATPHSIQFWCLYLCACWFEFMAPEKAGQWPASGRKWSCNKLPGTRDDYPFVKYQTIQQTYNKCLVSLSCWVGRPTSGPSVSPLCFIYDYRVTNASCEKKLAIHWNPINVHTVSP